jgi:hypothetical protein
LIGPGGWSISRARAASSSAVRGRRARWRRDVSHCVPAASPAPYDPKFLALNGQGSAATSSDLTDSLGSTEILDDSAAFASAVPTRPSAQAACARTNGSGSERATVSTGPASGDPQLPSPTQTLRANPARPARRIADPLENESHAASSNAASRSSISDGAAVPGCEEEEPGSGFTPNGGSPGARAAYPLSALGSEKVRLNGHTSWETCRLTCYEVPLRTGCRTVRPRRR